MVAQQNEGTIQGTVSDAAGAAWREQRSQS
jgi:hypothetical protein